jgi:perosamine synthetase
MGMNAKTIYFDFWTHSGYPMTHVHFGKKGISGLIPLTEPLLDGRELEYVTECIRTNWVSSLGTFVTRFEKDFAAFCECSHGVAVSNGTVALHLALVVLGIGPEDEVIVPTLTFVATANAVRYTGAQPVFVDSEPYTWNLDPAAVEAAITPRTRAIIPVHLYGHPADMDAIMDIADRHNLWVIEDAAEAHGAKYKGRTVGSLGHMGCFSFYGNKIITTGEGGMLVTNDSELAKRSHFLKDHAMDPDKRYWHPEIGYNYRLTNIQAALGVAQLERIDHLIGLRRKHAQQYNNELRNTRGLTLPPEAEWARSVYWMYSVLVEDDYGLNREDLMRKLKASGIDTRPFFYPSHIMPPYQTGQHFPVAEELGRKGINLPSGPTLAEDDISTICRVLKEQAL